MKNKRGGRLTKLTETIFKKFILPKIFLHHQIRPRKDLYLETYTGFIFRHWYE